MIPKAIIGEDDQAECIYQNTIGTSAGRNIYNNIPLKPLDAAVYQNGPPQIVTAHNVAYRQTTDLDDEDEEEDVDSDDLPPPSPVSSSYSELTRTINSNRTVPKLGAVHVQHNELADRNRNQHHLQQQQQLQTMFPAHSSSSGSSSAPVRFQYHMPPHPSYSNYESIYEPINPKPSHHYPQQQQTQQNPGNYHQAQARHIYNKQFQDTASLSGGTLSPYPYKNDPPPSSVYMAQYGEDSKEHEVNVLTDLLVRSLAVGQGSGDYEQIPNDQSSNTIPGGGDIFGCCVKCNGRVIGENSGCSAMDQIYHIECFTCCQCQVNLQGRAFYPIENQPFCEEDYLNTLEKCSVCVKPILERILRATGKPYHPQCFCCIVCGKSLDGIPFTVDATNQIHCIEDFHKYVYP